MANDMMFLCQHCMTGGEGRRPRTTLNPLSDIAFAMPENEVYEKIRKTVAAVDRDLARQIAEDKRFKCITMEDIDQFLVQDPAEREVLRGELRLTWEWLRKRIESMGLSSSKINGQTGYVYSDTLEFRTKKGADGSKIPDKIKDAHRTTICREQRCRNCGRMLPRDTGRAPEVRILLQGNARAGKTSIIISVLWWFYLLSQKEESGIKFALPQDDESVLSLADEQNAYHQWFRTELEGYLGGRKVKKTPAEQREPGSVSVYVKIGDQEMVLTFLDMPGEFFEGDRNGQGLQSEVDGLMDQYTMIYKNVDAIWTCLQYEIMVDKKWERDRETILELTGIERQNLALDREQYKKRLKDIRSDLKPYGLKNKPHAVILTKVDSLEGRVADLKSVFHPNYQTPSQNLVDGYAYYRKGKARFLPALQEFEFQKISSRVAQFCEAAVKEGGENILEELKKFSDETAYFAVSSYGRSVPKEGRNELVPQPYHVQLPLLWTLAVLDKLRISYDVEVGSWFRKVTEHDAVFFKDADAECETNLTKGEGYYKSHRRKKGAR